MRCFPQLATGAPGQYPVVRRRRVRTVVNDCLDGRSVRLSEPVAVTEWELFFEELTDGELEALCGLFEAAEGRLGSFTFLDPVGNLLCWSEKLDEPVWEKGPLAMVEPVDERVWRVTNTAGAAQQVTQLVEAPAAYHYCLSLYLRGSGQVALIRGDQRLDCQAGAEWRRVVLAGESASAEETVRFGLELGPGAAVEVREMQVEAQTGASGYKRTASRGGVYEDARFNQDELRVVTLGPGRHSCELKVVNGEHF